MIRCVEMWYSVYTELVGAIPFVAVNGDRTYGLTRNSLFVSVAPCCYPPYPTCHPFLFDLPVFIHSVCRRISVPT